MSYFVQMKVIIGRKGLLAPVDVTRTSRDQSRGARKLNTAPLIFLYHNAIRAIKLRVGWRSTFVGQSE